MADPDGQKESLTQNPGEAPASRKGSSVQSLGGGGLHTRPPRQPGPGVVPEWLGLGRTVSLPPIRSQ